MSLRIEGLVAYYGKSKILQGVDLSVDRGEMAALMGRNGVGKSTTLKSVMGIVKPSKGRVLAGDREIQGMKPHRIARLGIGYIPEDRRIFNRLTAQENLLMGRRAMIGRDPEQENLWSIERIFSVFPILKSRASQSGASLSGGEQQMLTIARTLMGNPETILVDEPTEGLAPMIRKDVGNTLQEINRTGTGVLLVEQNMNVALDLASRTYVMSKGHIVYKGLSDELRQNDDVRQRYLEV
jgi:branched-chain amino acid transport system ATP-binding protein